ncbi:helix-turn-helix domain-containing protein [Ruthenibacterium lactatiformans]|uniref:helix-turn-helix domain-containing protein n=1 Tax=Ruthenibacterium lactatiformans TaxID=1550024 RepID=UPI0039A2A212
MLESIRELRRRKNFTLRQLSEKTGYTVSFLSSWSAASKPVSDALRAIAQALDVSLVSLMNNSDYCRKLRRNRRRRRRERLLRAAAGRPAHNAH